MGRVTESSLVLLAIVCCVQCQWNRFVNSDVDFQLLNPKELRTSYKGWSPHKEDLSIQFIPTPAPASKPLAQNGSLRKAQSSHNTRTRRQAFLSKNSITAKEPFEWSHHFTIENNHPTSLTKESVYTWQENVKRLTYTLEKSDFTFINPTGLRISIPANNANMRIVDFRFKLNEEFRDQERGHFASTGFKTGGQWTYDVPQMKVKQGDKIFYWMRLSLDKETFDVVVKGVVDITLGNPHISSPKMESIPFRPTAFQVLAPQPQSGSLTPTLGGELGSGTRGGFAWNHQYTINATNSGGFTKDSASSWKQNAEFLERILQNNLNFQFVNPKGLIISIPDDNIIIMDFRIKLNQKFWDNDVGHFAPDSYKQGGQWMYYIPQVQVRQGDKIYYQMRVKRGQDSFDAIVRGLLEIIQGNPNSESTSIHKTSAPYHPQTFQVVNSYLPNGDWQPPLGVGQPSSAGAQPASGEAPPAFGGGQPPLRGEQQGNKGGQAFSWNHKFSSINLNTTSEAGFTQASPNSWPEKADEFFKKTLDRDITFQFLNPAGLKILLKGNDVYFSILAFNAKLNEEFKTLDAGHLVADFTRTSDGQWSYYYPNLNLKQGDKVYYWMRVTFGKEMWLYVVKGQLEVTLGEPHTGANSIRTTTPSPQPQTYVVNTQPIIGSGTGGQAVKWHHEFTINNTSNLGNTNSWLEEAQLLRNMLQKNTDFKFLNPSGLSLSFEGEDKDFRILAFNIKLNEEFRTLGSGHYVANITRQRDGQWTYYYPNLKFKQGDKIYYWMRVMLGKDMTDYIVKGQLTLIQGDPHIGGAIPNVPPPFIWTQTPSPSKEVPVQQNNNPSPIIVPSTQTPIPQNNQNQVPPLQTAIPQSINQFPNQVPITQTDTLNRLNNNQTPNNFIPTQTPVPLTNGQPPNQPPLSPLPLDINQFTPTAAPVTNIQTQPCAASQSTLNAASSPPCQEEVVVDYQYNNMDGTHKVTIVGKQPLHISVAGVPVDRNRNYSDNANNRP